MTTPSAPGPASPGAGGPDRAASPPARPPIFRHPWRVAIVAVIGLAVLNLGIILLDSSDTSETGRVYPSAVEIVSPEPGAIARLQDTIVADLRDDLTGVLLVEGAEVPEDQTDRVIPLGQVGFRPGEDKDLVRFEPGNVNVTVLYWKQGKARPAQPGRYSWSFRAGA